MAAGASAPAIPGYHVTELRRENGTHGGLATYYRQLFKLESSKGNEYGLHTKLIVPTSEQVNIVNVYLPPTSSLARRDILELQATSQLETVLEAIQPQLTTVICGDFNARIGDRIPLLTHGHPTRTATDSHVCPRATWFISFCKLHNMYILNGLHIPAALTCHTGRGESTVDYILCSTSSPQIQHTPLQACNITDHDLLCVTLPVPHGLRATPPHLQTHSGTAAHTSMPMGPLAETRVGHPTPGTPAQKNTEA